MPAPPAAAPQADAPATPQAGDTPDTSQVDAQPKLTPEQALAELAEARKEAAKYRTQLRGFEKAEAERKQAELSEVERRDARIRELEESLTAHERRARDYALRDAIGEVIASDEFPLTPVVGTPQLLKLLDTDRLEWQEDGRPKNPGTVLAALAKTAPALFQAKPKRPGPSDGGYTQTQPMQGGNDAVNQLIRGGRR
jgi:hypothetical protein